MERDISLLEGLMAAGFTEVASPADGIVVLQGQDHDLTKPYLSFDETGLQTAWDSTSVGAFEKCPRFYQLRHVEGWQPKRRSVHLVFGGHYAKALERFHRLQASGMSEDDATIEVVRLLMLETWEHELDAEGNRLPGTGHAWESDHPAKSRDTLIRSVVWYLDQFGDDDAMQTLILDSGEAAAELSFSLPLTDEYLYCGHIDRVVVYEGRKYVQDQKTSGTTITARYFEGFKPDVQMGGYTFAGMVGFDLPVAGVVIDAAQIAVGFTRFERGFVTYGKDQVAEWKESTLATIEEAKRAHEAGFYPMRRSSCGNYGGCEFRKVCSAARHVRQNILRTDFEQARRWDPLEKR